MCLTGTIMGYDPGGNSHHGVSFLTYHKGQVISSSINTYQTAEEVIESACQFDKLLGVGIDTLTCWSTGNSGWRPADRWLKQRYTRITNSIASPNSLFGSMGLNGMAVLLSLREGQPGLPISETHPKVLYFELAEEKYDYSDNHQAMDELLSAVLKTNIITENDHEWDSMVSVYAAAQGIDGNWVNDLHSLQNDEAERLIEPCGKTHYWWPCS